MNAARPARSRLDGGPLPLLGYVPSDTDVRPRHVEGARAALTRFADEPPLRMDGGSLVLSSASPPPTVRYAPNASTYEAGPMTLIPDETDDGTGPGLRRVRLRDTVLLPDGPMTLTLRHTTNGRTAILVRSGRRSVGRLLVDHGADALRAALDAPGDQVAARRAHRLIVDGTLDMLDAYLMGQAPAEGVEEASTTLLAAFHWHAVDRAGETLPLAAHAPYADLPSRCWSRSDRRWIDADLDAPTRALLARVDAAAGRYFTVAVIENSDPASAFQLTFDRHEISLPRPDSFEAIRTLAGFDRAVPPSIDANCEAVDRTRD